MTVLITLDNRALVQGGSVLLAYTIADLFATPQIITVKPDAGFVALMTRTIVFAESDVIKVDVIRGGTISGASPASVIKRDPNPGPYNGGQVLLGGSISGGSSAGSFMVRASADNKSVSSAIGVGTILAIIGEDEETSIELTAEGATICDVAFYIIFVKKTIYDSEIARGITRE